jgi:hypothetical protein
MGPLEFIGPIRGYPMVSQAGGIQGMLAGIGLAIVAVAIVTGVAIKYRTPR